MNTQTPQEKDFTVFIPEQKINPFLLDKLKQLSTFISEPEKGGFFVETEEKLTGQKAMQFICLSNVFKYEITFHPTINKSIVFFNKL